MWHQMHHAIIAGKVDGATATRPIFPSVFPKWKVHLIPQSFTEPSGERWLLPPRHFVSPFLPESPWPGTFVFLWLPLSHLPQSINKIQKALAILYSGHHGPVISHTSIIRGILSKLPCGWLPADSISFALITQKRRRRKTALLAYLLMWCVYRGTLCSCIFPLLFIPWWPFLGNGLLLFGFHSLKPQLLLKPEQWFIISWWLMKSTQRALLDHARLGDILPRATT